MNHILLRRSRQQHNRQFVQRTTTHLFTALLSLIVITTIQFSSSLFVDSFLVLSSNTLFGIPVRISTTTPIVLLKNHQQHKIIITMSNNIENISEIMTNDGIVNNNTPIEVEQNSRNNVKILGICGGIGSGKSTACQLLVSEFNCLAHIDADKIAHGVYAPGSEGVNALVDEFSTDILVKDEGSSDTIKIPFEIHRPSLGAIVFSDTKSMKKLEQIVWPRTRQLIEQQIQNTIVQQQQQDIVAMDVSEELPEMSSSTKTKKLPIIIVEAAMLLDAEWYKDLVDAVWTVTSGKNEIVALQRLMKTRGLSRDEATKRLDAQKLRRGIGNIQEEIDNQIVTAVIENDGSIEYLKDQLRNHLKYVNLKWYSR